ncbi:PH domain-containing protein [Maribellus maritimus]|uniref:PH domain-containing protein n=1 Tax=Maribellus maritimus TaxID=2870838 RepID=UPI001EEB4843|nr:PH domain-containing protein [Maribellus maritimus]MCG6185903.1 PH domain-containing protein [Maribellus maritimus]
MNSKFSCKKSRSFGEFLITVSLFITLVAFGLPVILKDTIDLVAFIVSSLFILITIGLFLWLWFGTYYIIDNEILIAKFGPLTWKVPINEISFIRLNQETIGGTWKLTLSWKCIELKYKKPRSIFISPNNQSVFIDRLVKINPQIEIKQK